MEASDPRPPSPGRAGYCVGVDVGGQRKGLHLAVVDEHAKAVSDVVARPTLAKPEAIASDCPISSAKPGERSRLCEREVAREHGGVRADHGPSGARHDDQAPSRIVQEAVHRTRIPATLA